MNTMSEDEATKKLCPLLAAMNSVLPHGTGFSANCKGSFCMMWRRETNSAVRGYCGLAGQHGLAV